MERERLGRQDEREDASITHLLRALQAGDRRNFDELFSQVYDQLQELAHRVRRGSTDQTLNTTALVHEAYVKLVPSAELEWESRAHFFSVAARAMRQILVGSARKRLAQKRGGVDAWAVTFDEAAHAAPIRAAEPRGRRGWGKLVRNWCVVE
jgi:RNA polymerase sigma factor (TIGR02999 family)